MNMQRWKQEYYNSAVKKTMPVLSFPGCQLTGCSVLDVVTDARKQADCMIAVAKAFDTAVAVGPMDLSVEAEAFGATVHFGDHEVPTVPDALLDIDRPEAAGELPVPSVGAGRTGVYLEAISLAKQSITDRPVFAGCIGPFSLAGRLLDMSNVMIACLEEPEMLEALLEKATEFLIRYVQALKDAGADGIIMAEPAAGLLSPVLNEEFSVPYVKRIADGVRDESFMFCYHNCGPYVPRQIEDIVTIGADIYHFGDAIDLKDVKDAIPADAFLAGNLSPVVCFKSATAREMAEATDELMKQFGTMPNFIPSSGCDIPPNAKVENVRVFMERVSAYYKGESL